MMTNSKQVITSLLTEHFRYTPLTLLDDIINTVNELVYRAVTAVEEGLTSAPAASLGFAERAAEEGRPLPPATNAESAPTSDTLYPESRLEIEHGVHQLETLLESTVDKNFDKLEIFVLRSILSVPEDLVQWLQLKHYENLDFSAANAPDGPTAQSLYLLRRKLHETRKLNAALRVEQARNAALITQLKTLLSTPPRQPPQSTTIAESTPVPASAPLAFLSTSSTSQQQTQHLTAQAQALLPHLPTLRHLLSTLQSRLPLTSTTPTQPPAQSTDPASVAAAQHAEERRSYIEQQTQKRLERQGLESGDHGAGSAMRDISGKIGADEVRGIESVVGALGPRRGASVADQDAMEE